MNTTPPEPKPARRAGAKEKLKTKAASLGRRDAQVGFAAPLVASLLVGAAAYVFAPRIDAATASKYSSLFSTSGQIIVTLLVALAIELRSLRELNAQRLVIGTLFYVALGVGAAVLALNPTLHPGLYRWLFAVTLASGCGALLSVVLIAYRGLEDEVTTRRRKATRP
ncbi:MAG TPA: hypothetical protein VMT37_14030 [Solirubrobacterales bacterium]|nr:hypothetical protein [Solirubrobacterales bacterium]